MAEDSGNALGLDFSVTPPETRPAETEDVTSPVSGKPKPSPYVNPDRFKTGGNQREALSSEALEERIARIRLQNEKIKQRRLDVAADEAAWNKTQEAELAKKAEARRIQQDIDNTRSRNAKHKMDRVSNRAWDSEKVKESDKTPIVSTAWEMDVPKKIKAKEPPPVAVDDDWDYNLNANVNTSSSATTIPVGSDWAGLPSTDVKSAEDEWGSAPPNEGGTNDWADPTGSTAKIVEDHFGGGASTETPDPLAIVHTSTSNGNDWANSPTAKIAAVDENEGWGPPPSATVDEPAKVATNHSPPSQIKDNRGTTRGRGRGGERGGRGRARGERGARGGRGRGRSDGAEWANSSDDNIKSAKDDRGKAPAAELSSIDSANAPEANASTNDWAYSPSSKPTKTDEEIWGAPPSAAAEVDENEGSVNGREKVAADYQAGPSEEGARGRGRGRGGRARGDRSRGRGRPLENEGRFGGGTDPNDWSRGGGGRGRARARGRGGRGGEDFQEPRDVPAW